ncbi:MAG TPA: hypothetical protein PK400_08195 [Phycisphaerales bacterium]|nr:hypothetical protein [Phycisphaerales bacterium]HRQ75394.1 hypothetical protein [Phycisphaerales bacterium]
MKLCRISPVIVCAVLAAAVDAAVAVPPAVQAERLSTLNRLVRHFDFEEARHAPYEMPFHFHRVGAARHADSADDPPQADGMWGAADGFPPFGTMRLSNDHASSGDWSFKFSLDGGSLAARVPTAVLPAMPGADYLIAVRVRTEGLTHARARLAAWLHDVQGNMIPQSRVMSRLVDTAGEWHTIAVEVRGDYDNVGDLVLELQLLQPKQFGSHDLPGKAASPVLSDITGFAWFDDVSVWHLPRLEVRTDEPLNLFVSPRQPSVTVLVRDVANTELEAKLRVFNLDGEQVYERPFSSPLLPAPRRVDLPVSQHGWYRAVLEVYSEGDLAATKSLDFALLAPDVEGLGRSGDARFMLGLHHDWPLHMAMLPEVMRRLHVGSVMVPVWQRETTARTANMMYEAAHRAMQEMLRDRIEVQFSLERVPDELAMLLDLSPDEVPAALGHDPAVWREYLHDLLINFGLEVQRWQLGDVGGNGEWPANATAVLGRAANVLGEFVPNPVLAITATADQTADAPPVGALAIDLPHQIPPESISEYAHAWPDAEITLWLQALPEQEYAVRRRAMDFAFRVLYAWRSDVDRIAVEAPWRSPGESFAPAPQPDPTLIVWREMTRHLAGRHFGGELAIGNGLRCWILQGTPSRSSAIILWAEQGAGDEPQQVTMQLGSGAVNVFDLFGNAFTVDLIDGAHHIHVGDEPVFVENINLELVQFRSGFALAPAFVPSEHRIHEHELVIRNPWPIPISGTLVLAEGSSWRISPRAHAFTIRPGSEVRLPVEITFDRSIIAGTKRLEAEVLLAADAPFRLEVAAEFTVGLPHIDSAATWRVVRNVETGRDDLIITQYITNKGSHPVSAEAFLLAPPEANVRQQRRIVAGLEPGELAIRLFQIPDGARLLAGSSLRLGVTDRSGQGRLNYLLRIPEFIAPRASAEQ